MPLATAHRKLREAIKPSGPTYKITINRAGTMQPVIDKYYQSMVVDLILVSHCPRLQGIHIHEGFTSFPFFLLLKFIAVAFEKLFGIR